MKTNILYIAIIIFLIGIIFYQRAEKNQNNEYYKLELKDINDSILQKDKVINYWKLKADSAFKVVKIKIKRVPYNVYYEKKVSNLNPDTSLRFFQSWTK